MSELPPGIFWIALLAVLSLVALALVGLLAAGTYLLLQMARERRLEANAQWNAPVPPLGTASEEEPTDEEKASLVLAAIDAARDEGRLAKDDWREEKLADGWSEEDVEDFLANRPLLELN